MQNFGTYDGVTGFYVFIMLLRSRNHGESSGQSLEPVGSEIFIAYYRPNNYVYLLRALFSSEILFLYTHKVVVLLYSYHHTKI